MYVCIYICIYKSLKRHLLFLFCYISECLSIRSSDIYIYIWSDMHMYVVCCDVSVLLL